MVFNSTKGRKCPMKMRTFREVYEEIGVSRTTLQGWVNEILEKPTLQDDTGWYFDENDLEKIWQIRFFKQLRYSNNTIKKILNNPNFDKKKCLEEQIQLLKKEKDELENLISVACLLMETGMSPKTVRFGISEIEQIKHNNIYNDILCMLAASFNIFNQLIDEDEIISDFIESEVNARLTAFEKIMHLCEKGIDSCSKEVQLQISLIPEAIAFDLLFSSDSEIALEIDKDYGEGKAAYFYDALQHYHNINTGNEVGKELSIALENIAELGINKFTANSEEVQSEVKKIYDFFSILSDKGKLKMLKNIGEVYGSKSYINAFDNGASRGVSWFISRAIQVYCDRLKKVF